MKKWAILAVALLASSSAFADFEGVLFMKMSSEHMDGTMRVFLSPKGVRNEMDMRAAQRPMHFATLVLFERPDVAYQISDERRTVTEVDLKKANEMAEKSGDALYTVKTLGDETILGYWCRHVMITGKKSGEIEMWTTREILNYSAFAKTQGADGQMNAAFMKSLKDAGADGFPVKSIYRSQRGQFMMELVSAEKKSLPASLFQVPAGYTKTGGYGAGNLPPEALKAMQERMKNMSPEQREMLEKAMNGGGK